VLVPLASLQQVVLCMAVAQPLWVLVELMVMVELLTAVLPTVVP
jgi:hypothetical protein